MSYRLARVAAAAGCVLAHRVAAQAPTPPDPVGSWRGTSVCQVRPSACNDEIVVYRITRTNTIDSLSIDARKIVDTKEEEMGVLGCRFNAPSAQVTCVMPNGVWHFTIRGDSLIGELRRPDGTKFRYVRAARSR